MKLDMKRQFSLLNMAARDGMKSAISDSNIIKLRTEIQN